MSERVSEQELKPNIEEPRWEQSTYMNRARHFLTITNPLNVLATSGQLEEAAKIVDDYKKDKYSPSLTLDQLWAAKNLYDSAFHPETKEKMILIGRMSAQVPMNMAITGCMMTFYKTTPAVIFWQWLNQSFNAVVNYTNRSGDNPIPASQLGISYAGATTGALVTALGLNSLVKSAPPLIGRFVPLAAVAAANCVNIPLMRSRELKEGIMLLDKEGNQICASKRAAKEAIGMVTFSRIIMASPGMILTPIIMNSLDKKPWFAKYARFAAPVQVMLCGFFLVFATPLCCALFPQISAISTSTLEPEVQEKIRSLPNAPETVYYNKGL